MHCLYSVFIQSKVSLKSSFAEYSSGCFGYFCCVLQFDVGPRENLLELTTPRLTSVERLIRVSSVIQLLAMSNLNTCTTLSRHGLFIYTGFQSVRRPTIGGIHSQIQSPLNEIGTDDYGRALSFYTDLQKRSTASSSSCWWEPAPSSASPRQLPATPRLRSSDLDHDPTRCRPTQGVPARRRPFNTTLTYYRITIIMWKLPSSCRACVSQ